MLGEVWIYDDDVSMNIIIDPSSEDLINMVVPESISFVIAKLVGTPDSAEAPAPRSTIGLSVLAIPIHTMSCM
jgi:hypothetical protein